MKDVCTEGGGGLINLQTLGTNITERLREMRTRGREGVKNPKIFADILYQWSPRALKVQAGDVSELQTR